MSKPGADPSSGISLGAVLRLPKRHPACRRREAQPGSCTERENLDGDAQGESTSGSNREAESTDAPAASQLYLDEQPSDGLTCESVAHCQRRKNLTVLPLIGERSNCPLKGAASSRARDHR